MDCNNTGSISSNHSPGEVSLRDFYLCKKMKDMNIFIATLLKCDSIYVDSGQVYNSEYPIPYRLAELLGKCGYRFKEELRGWISPEYENKILKDLEDYLERTFGIGKSWRGVYVSPDDPAYLDDLKMRLDQIIIYGNPEHIRETRDEEKSDTWETNDYQGNKFLGKSGKKDLINSVSSLLSSPIPLGNQDSEILDWGLSELELEYPEKIECKEILCRVLSRGRGEKCISGVNDILRLVTYLSYNDTTLGWKGRIKLSGPQRKLVLGFLEYYLKEHPKSYLDAKKYYHKWIITSQVLHTKEEKYPKSYEFFSILHGKDKTWMHTTFEAKLQQEYNNAGKDGSIKEVINLLSTRGGEFIRRFDSILRRTWEKKDPAFCDLGSKLMSIQGIRPKTLLDLYKMYSRRNLEIPRSFKDKSGVRHVYESLPGLDQGLIDITQNLILTKLKDIYGQEKTMEGQKAYIDIPEDAELCLSLRSGVEGQILPGHIEHFEKTGILRFFSQWVDPMGNQDLDIHAWFVNEDFTVCNRVGYNTSFIDRTGMIRHSGDVRHIKGDCAEYINIDFRRSKELPYRWMIIGVQNFDAPRLCDLENYIGVAKVSGDKKNGMWVPSENEILTRTKVTLMEKNLLGYIVDFKESTIKYILEGIQSNLNSSVNLDLIKQYTVKDNLGVKKLLRMYLEEKGCEVVEEPDEETKIYTTQDICSGEISNLLLGA